MVDWKYGSSFRFVGSSGSSPGDQVGIGSSISVEPATAGGGGFFHDAIQKAPGSRVKRLLVLNCAANDRGRYEVEEWFTPSAAQFNTRRRFSRLPGAFYIASRKTPPQRRRNRPKYSRRFRVALAWLDFHGATLDLRCR